MKSDPQTTVHLSVSTRHVKIISKVGERFVTLLRIFTI